MIVIFQPVFLLIFLLKEVSAVNFCDLPTSSLDPRAEHIAVREWLKPQEKCYFAIKPESINQFSTCPDDQFIGLEFTIDLELGRKICNSYEATLPMIKTKEENDAIQELELKAGKKQLFRLGCLGQDATTNEIRIEWDDGTTAGYDDSSKYIPEWTRRGHFYTAIKLKSGSWYSPERPQSTRMIILVCQQDSNCPPVLIKEPLTLPLSNLPPIDLGLPKSNVDSLSDFCDFSVNSIDPRIGDIDAPFHSYTANGIPEKCFFIFKRRHWPINKCVGTNDPHLIIDTEQAAKICQAYSATLPKIKNIEQWNGLGAFTYVMPWRDFSLYLNIPLGIKSQSAEKKTIVWEDGTIYSFKTTHPFDNKVEWSETKGTHLYMRLDGPYVMLKSRSVDPNDQKQDPSEIVVCEQDLSRFPTKQPLITNPYPADVNFDLHKESSENIADFCNRTQAGGDSRNGWIQNRIYYQNPAAKFNEPQEKCFFSIKVNLSLNGFDLDHARSICKKFSANLPMPRDAMEHFKLIGLGKSMMGLGAVYYVPLGMKKWSYFDSRLSQVRNLTRIYWDDGSVTQAHDVSYILKAGTSYAHWHKWNDRDIVGVNVTFFNGRDWTWWSKRSNEVDEPIVLICEQDFGYRRPYITTEEQRQHATTVRVGTTTTSVTDRVTSSTSSKPPNKLGLCSTMVVLIVGITVCVKLGF